MDSDHPALLAARTSWRCVQAKDKQGWLDAMADDICIEDPIGVAPTNPTGKGVRGKAAVSDFWDRHIEPTTISIEVFESFAAGAESAHRMQLTTRFENGVKTVVNGMFTYVVNDQAKLTSLRGYWSMDDMEIEQP